VGTYRYLAAVGALALAAVLPSSALASPTPHFTKVSAQNAGEELMINFTEAGLQPGQNYAYSGTATSATESYRCYTDDTFLPRRKHFTKSAIAFSADPRGYTANTHGVVRGFYYIDLVTAPFTRAEQCPKGQSAIPVHVSYTDFDVVNVNNSDYREVPGTVSGPIEPD
jgi:hypothetical protein